MKQSKEKTSKEIKKWIRGNFRQRLSTFLKKTDKEIEKQHERYSNRFAYIVAIGGILFLLAILGEVIANNNLPQGEWKDFSLSYNNYKVNTSVTNLDHSSDLLPIETERIRYNITLINESTEDTIFRVNEWVMNSGEQTHRGRMTEHFVAAEKEELVQKTFPFKKPGINIVNFHFEMYPVRIVNDEPKVDFVEGVIEENSTSFNFRVYSQSDYNFQVERFWLYKYLWVAAAPFVIIMMKHLRDILEGR